MTLLILLGGEPQLDALVSDIEVYTRRTVRIKFTDEVVVNDAYNDINNYDISIVEGTGPVEVVSVLSTNESTTLELILVTQPMTAGTTYSLAVTQLFRRGGTTFNLVGSFIYRDTKTDSALRSIPKHFDKRETSLIATLLTAIGRQDDLLGGSRNDILTIE